MAGSRSRRGSWFNRPASVRVCRRHSRKDCQRSCGSGCARSCPSLAVRRGGRSACCTRLLAHRSRSVPQERQRWEWRGQCGLTLPSSGLAPAAQAWPSFHSGPSPHRLREPLMSNVRRHKSCRLRPLPADKLPRDRLQPVMNTRSRVSAHLNRGPKSSVPLGYEPELETAALLLPDCNSHILGIRWFPTSIRPAPSYKTWPRAICSRRSEV